MQIPASIDKEIKYFKKQINELNITSLSNYLVFDKVQYDYDFLLICPVDDLSVKLKDALTSFKCGFETNIHYIVKNKYWQFHKTIIVNEVQSSNAEIVDLINKFSTAAHLSTSYSSELDMYTNKLPINGTTKLYKEKLRFLLDEASGDPKTIKKNLSTMMDENFINLDSTLKKLLTEYKLKIKIENANKSTNQYDGYSNSFQNIKTKYNDYLSQFEKLYLESFNEKYHNSMGSKFAMLEQLIDDSIDLAEEKQTKKSKITITDENINKYNTDLEKDITFFFDTLAHSRNAYFSNLNRDMLAKLQALNINYQPSTLSFSDATIKSKVSKFILFSKNDFETYIPKKRLIEYFSGSRQYVMIVIMMVSLFGLRSVLTKNSELYFPAIIVLLGLGTYGIINQSKVEEREARKKAVDTAKAHLISELKNKISVIDAILQKHFIKDLKDQISDILTKSELEMNTKQKENSSSYSAYSYINSPEKIADKLQNLISKSTETQERIKVMISEIK